MKKDFKTADLIAGAFAGLVVTLAIGYGLNQIDLGLDSTLNALVQLVPLLLGGVVAAWVGSRHSKDLLFTGMLSSLLAGLFMAGISIGIPLMSQGEQMFAGMLEEAAMAVTAQGIASGEEALVYAFVAAVTSMMVLLGGLALVLCLTITLGGLAWALFKGTKKSWSWKVLKKGFNSLSWKTGAVAFVFLLLAGITQALTGFVEQPGQIEVLLMAYGGGIASLAMVSFAYTAVLEGLANKKHSFSTLFKQAVKKSKNVFLSLLLAWVLIITVLVITLYVVLVALLEVEWVGIIIIYAMASVLTVVFYILFTSFTPHQAFKTGKTIQAVKNSFALVKKHFARTVVFYWLVLMATSAYSLLVVIVFSLNVTAGLVTGALAGNAFITALLFFQAVFHKELEAMK
jgi:hypothetical protein